MLRKVVSDARKRLCVCVLFWAVAAKSNLQSCFHSITKTCKL